MLGSASICASLVTDLLITFISASLSLSDSDLLPHPEHAVTTNAKQINPKMGASPPYTNDAEESQLQLNLPVPLLTIVSFILLSFQCNYPFLKHICTHKYRSELCFFYNSTNLLSSIFNFSCYCSTSNWWIFPIGGYGEQVFKFK